MEEKYKPNPEAFWQITFPLILGSALIIALGVWVIVAAITGSDIRQYADTSAILVLIPFILLTLIPVALTSLLAYGLIKLNQILPKYTQQGIKFVTQVADTIQKIADKIVEPAFRVESFWASLRTLFRR